MATKSILRSVAPLAAAMALFATVGVKSASADVTYTFGGVIGDTIQLTQPDAVTGIAGQIKLNLTPSGTILAWCLDVYDFLQNSGTYSVTLNGPIDNHNPSVTPNKGHIGALMALGDQLIKAGNGMSGFSVADISAAIQVAIWTAEYGAYNASTNPLGFAYSLSGLPSGFAGLVSSLDSQAFSLGNRNYNSLDPDPINCPTGQTQGCTHPTNQHLGYAVPGPLAGAGLPGLAAACAVLIALARRRRRVALT
jgi:hypothetical protein